MNGIACCKTNERSSCTTKEMVPRGALFFYVHSEEIPLYESVQIIVRSKKTLARDCRIRDSMFLFLADCFFFFMSSCSKKPLLFCLINLTALIYLLAYLPYVMFKITVVKDFASPRLLVLPPCPPTEELFDVEMCAFKNSYIEC